ncbi:hypothetical protein B0H21DRAFT_826982 [Amylocystis lapponica]|nr:hypothetical protein B0H21DRAFT_826982 [Amylocystis lapponica]
MLARFWGNLQLHPFKLTRDPCDKRALIVYQAEQREAWHQAINEPGGAWDISVIEETILLETRDRLYRSDRLRIDRERDAKDAERDARDREREARATRNGRQPHGARQLPPGPRSRAARPDV